MGSRGAKGGGQKKQKPVVPPPTTPENREKTLEELVKSPSKTPQTFDDMLGTINPTYGEVYGDEINCQTCALAAELRARGIDVEATPNEDDDRGYVDRNKPKSYRKLLPREVDEELFRNTYGSVWENKAVPYTKMQKSILDNVPEGGRGVITLGRFTRNGYSGHIVNFEVKNGQVIVYDHQSSSKMDLKTLLRGEGRWIRRRGEWQKRETYPWKEASFARIDNVSIDTSSDLAKEFFVENSNSKIKRQGMEPTPIQLPYDYTTSGWEASHPSKKKKGA